MQTEWWTTRKVGNGIITTILVIVEDKICQSISIVPADKGRVTVVMNKSDYIDKCESHLSDVNVYEKVT